MFDNFLNKRIMMALPMAAMLVLAGCKEDETAKTPAPEPVDLSQTEDLFTEPIKPNPLATDPSNVVVRVNGEDITRGDIIKVMDAVMQRVGGRVPPEHMQQFQSQIFAQIRDDLITKKLLDLAVADADIEVDPSEVDTAIDEIKSGIPEGQSLESLLAAQGEDIESLKNSIREEIAKNKLLESKTADVQPATEAEAKEYYDQNPNDFIKPENVTASHILIKFDPEDTDEAKAEKKAKLEKIRADIIAGTVSFEDAAQENSDCPSHVRGGALGTFGKGQMVPEFEVAAFTQDVGEVGDIVETKFGYHIIKVTARQDESTTVSFDEVKDKLVQFLTNQAKKQAESDYLKSLRDNANIEYVTM